jgi:hypothetical protein
MRPSLCDPRRGRRAGAAQSVAREGHGHVVKRHDVDAHEDVAFLQTAIFGGDAILDDFFDVDGGGREGGVVGLASTAHDLEAETAASQGGGEAEFEGRRGRDWRHRHFGLIG